MRLHYTHEALARIALHAFRVLERFGEVVGGDAEFRRVGFLALFGEADVNAAQANVAMLRRIGVEVHLLPPEDVGHLEPRMARGDVAVAAWEPRSGYADPVSTTAGFAEAARRAGAELLMGVTAHRLVAGRQGIEAVETSVGRIATRTVVVAAGYWSGLLLQPLGVELPLRPVRDAIAVVHRTRGFGPPHVVVSDRIQGAYYRPEGAELTLVGATGALEGHEDPDVERDRIPSLDEVAALVRRFARRFPSEAEAGIRRGYTGVYDCTPDLQPILGPVPGVDGLHVAVGFSGHGFKLSPAVGELVAERILRGHTTVVDIDLFSLARFREGRLLHAAHPYSVATLG